MLLLVACVAGGALVALSGCRPTNARMATVHESAYRDVDQTCEALKGAIEAQGFHCKGVLNLNQAMAKHGVHLDRQVRVVQFGRAEYAHAMLADTPEVSAFMPCAFGVYEGDDGKVHVSGMNRAVMAEMFGGTVAEVMRTRVAPDEAAIFKALERDAPR
ncbi:MAG: DUF302 domain-containing protein [Phycisphaerae bacterium]